MGEDNSREQVLRLRALHIVYSGLADEIATLLHANNGGTKDMSEEDYAKYRGLARKRDDIADEIRLLEYTLFEEDDTDTGEQPNDSRPNV
ncbi:hypothetical protein G4Y79_17635 [Phototrophicus methaneseepsis]|uniref:Uncharacterized protein n=1 Tax=Phototrophicus methaneseepsis TaxID=2710758 RepID=A0A7S8E6Z9_9CHLR|nr:hypothetical protein [Phototrophicus methaneseepsis]QPC81499.1 hypothetical protein G4Y79_17635 [Phototrophicus methaneseepsis]